LRSHRSPFRWLLHKEWRELMSSRAWWVMLLLIGPLVGVSFISAVRTYAELSGLNGTAAGVGEVFSPLIGIWAPTFSACELAAAFLLPFVAIRVVAADRQSGALKLELQRPMHALTRVSAKALVLLAGWLLASIAPLLGLALWRFYGGAIYTPEVLSVLTGHIINAALAIALAAAASTLTDHPATAAIVTLSVTVGTWILSFVAAVHGGRWAQAAAFTPTAIVAEFQHGLVRLSVLVISALLIAAGLSLAAIGTRLGTAPRKRVLESIALCAGVAAAIFCASFVPITWDLSESRMNSFPPADERLLASIQQPLRIEAHLAPEDPRRHDLETQTVSKLRRVMRDFEITYVSATSVGLFEQTSEHYGEIHYNLGGRTAVGRNATTDGVLESIYTLADALPAGGDVSADDEPAFRGHPLAVAPIGAPLMFYGAWPAAVLIAAMMSRRRGS
jgi:ABC-2 type transport system permease protein